MKSIVAAGLLLQDLVEIPDRWHMMLRCARSRDRLDGPRKIVTLTIPVGELKELCIQVLMDHFRVTTRAALKKICPSAFPMTAAQLVKARITLERKLAAKPKRKEPSRRTHAKKA